MVFFFPDSADVVDPAYDFEAECFGENRVRQRQEAYAHELLDAPPYDGLLLSMPMAGFCAGARGRNGSRYTEPQKYRLLYTGARRFFRLDTSPVSRRLKTMGDAGAYAYLYEDDLPVSVDDVLAFYAFVGFDYRLSPDLLILGYHEGTPPPEAERRFARTLEYARVFLKAHQSRGDRGEAVGVAQGWDGPSYARAVRALERMGYTYIALGGLGALSTPNIMRCVEAVAVARHPGTRLHLLGLSRLKHLARFEAWGVASLDTTMPLRQAFMDDRHNYHTLDAHFLALRVPLAEDNTRFERLIRAGTCTRAEVRHLEAQALRALRAFDAGALPAERAVQAVVTYEQLYNGRDQGEAYGLVLEARPWETCGCAVCRALGIEVVLLRNAERNRRRGFHNLHVFYQRLNATAPAAC